MLYLESVPDYVKASVDTVIKISTKEPPGDVLVFLTGYDEVEIVVRLLKDFANSLADSNSNGTFRLSFKMFKQVPVF